jgi:hypothetical protein
MPQATSFPEPAGPFAQVWTVVGRLAEYATTLYITLTTPSAPPLAANLPNPKAAANRALGAFLWLVALATTIAGDRSYMPIPRPDPSDDTKPAKKSRPQTFRPRTEDDRERDLRRRIRHAFATQPPGVVAERIARRLGLTSASQIWPHELTTVTQTPAEYFAHLPPVPIAQIPAAIPPTIPPKPKSRAPKHRHRRNHSPIPKKPHQSGPPR